MSSYEAEAKRLADAYVAAYLVMVDVHGDSKDAHFAALRAMELVSGTPLH